MSVPLSLIDAHAHLDQEEFAADLPAVLQRAKEAGVTHAIAIGVTAASSGACLRLASEHSQLRESVGIHPNYAAQAAPGDWDRIVELAQNPLAVALGETGLDRYRDHTPWPVQQDYFDRHLRLSQERGLPFVVHSRECDGEILAMLREAHRSGPLRGVMHSFTGSAETAAECLELGLFISFAGMLTFNKSQPLRDVAANIPADRLLVETDSPYLAPQPHRGERNEPARVVHTARRLAEVRGVGLDELAAQLTANAHSLFGWP